jgi:hypothetical protein
VSADELRQLTGLALRDVLDAPEQHVGPARNPLVDGRRRQLRAGRHPGPGRREPEEHWSDGPTSYLGMATSGFPKMFMIPGPNGPFTNLPPSIETQVEWIGRAIEDVATTDAGWIDVKPYTETDWTDVCSDVAHQTLFPKAASWIFGATIPGKKRTVMFYLGRMKQYRSLVAAEASGGYPGFVTAADVLAPAA